MTAPQSLSGSAARYPRQDGHGLNIARRSTRALLVILLLWCIYPSFARAASPSVQFQIFAKTGIALSDIVWTGHNWIVTIEGGKAIYALDAAGHGMHLWVSVPDNRGEMRCVPTPAKGGFPSETVFCHASAGQVYKISSDGRSIALFATIPTSRCSDGALTEDTGGAFGGGLVAATGGSDCGPGGSVYAISAKGQVRKVGDYAGPGGAENIAIAPAGFGSVVGQVLLTLDKHDRQGRLLAMDGRGKVRTLIGGLTFGLNPIAPIIAGSGASTGAKPGLYFADWKSHNVLSAPVAPFAAHQGAVLVGTERRGLIYLVEPAGSNFHISQLQTNLRAPDYNMEGAKYVSG